MERFEEELEQSDGLLRAVGVDLRHVHVVDEDDESPSGRRTVDVFCSLFDVRFKSSLYVHRGRSGREI